MPKLKFATDLIKKASRGFSDIPLTKRHPKLSKAFLEEHGYEKLNTDLAKGKPKADHYVDSKDGVIAYTYNGVTSSGKPKFSQKTFKNPTLKSLRNWMGYAYGGIVNTKPNVKPVKKSGGGMATKWESKWS